MGVNMGLAQWANSIFLGFGPFGPSLFRPVKTVKMDWTENGPGWPENGSGWPVWPIFFKQNNNFLFFKFFYYFDGSACFGPSPPSLKWSGLGFWAYFQKRAEPYPFFKNGSGRTDPFSRGSARFATSLRQLYNRLYLVYY